MDITVGFILDDEEVRNAMEEFRDVGLRMVYIDHSDSFTDDEGDHVDQYCIKFMAFLNGRPTAFTRYMDVSESMDECDVWDRAVNEIRHVGRDIYRRLGMRLASDKALANDDGRD